MTDRERFEAWVHGNGWATSRYSASAVKSGAYRNWHVDAAWQAWQARCPEYGYPMQPIANDQHGRPRFEANPIIDWLACEVTDLNRIAVWCADKGIDPKYQEQLAQLIGYSVDGYGSLSYVSDESYERAVAAAPQPGEES